MRAFQLLLPLLVWWVQLAVAQDSTTALISTVEKLPKCAVRIPQTIIADEMLTDIHSELAFSLQSHNRHASLPMPFACVRMKNFRPMFRSVYSNRVR
jgi:hypothetical protein